ncbi:SDR family NAD(P)-dependent oxidoreductase [Amycolatopsis echigonensis]|nr:SDR family NAD(P)-dependent oxidoreductase [Amycolatopsis echigonensis]
MSGVTGVRPFSMDVTDEVSTRVGVQQIIAESGRIDALVNNAGYGSFSVIGYGVWLGPVDPAAVQRRQQMACASDFLTDGAPVDDLVEVLGHAV